MLYTRSPLTPISFASRIPSLRDATTTPVLYRPGPGNAGIKGKSHFAAEADAVYAGAVGATAKWKHAH